MNEDKHLTTLTCYAAATSDIASIASTPQVEQLTVDQRLAIIFKKAHEHAQMIGEAHWPDDNIVVSVKLIDERDTSKLRCHYQHERLPAHRRSAVNRIINPDTIPLVGSLAGRAFRESRPIFVSDVRKSPKDFSRDVIEVLQGVVGSITAWPISYSGETVAVFTIDSPNKGTFSDSSSQLGVMRSIQALFEIALAVSFRSDDPRSSLKQSTKSAYESIIKEKEKTAEYDVFLCHNSKDKLSARRLAKRLIKAGIRPWLDEWALQPGTPWQDELQDAIGNIHAVAVFIGPDGIGPWQNKEIASVLDDFNDRDRPVIPVILTTCETTPDVPTFLKQRMWVDFRRRRPDPFKQLLWGITGENNTT